MLKTKMRFRMQENTKLEFSSKKIAQQKQQGGELRTTDNDNEH